MNLMRELVNSDECASKAMEGFAAMKVVVLQIGLAVTYTVTAAESMQVLELLGKDDDDMNPEMHNGLTKYIFIFAICQVAFSQIPNFQHLWWVSIIGAIMSLLYSALSGILAITAARDADDGPAYGRRVLESGTEFWRNVFTSLGAVTFAYGGHSVLLEIQATLKAPPPPLGNMMKGASCSPCANGLGCFHLQKDDVGT
jgi:amino acid permease